MAELTLKQVRKSFGALEVIKGIDLEVASGEFVVFVGPSGCGKSTLLRIIAGLEETTSGMTCGPFFSLSTPPTHYCRRLITTAAMAVGNCHAMCCPDRGRISMLSSGIII